MLNWLGLRRLRHATRMPRRRICLDTAGTQLLRKSLAPALQISFVWIEPPAITITREYDGYAYADVLRHHGPRIHNLAVDGGQEPHKFGDMQLT
jgi:hypothetical protein